MPLDDFLRLRKRSLKVTIDSLTGQVKALHGQIRAANMELAEIERALGTPPRIEEKPKDR